MQNTFSKLIYIILVVLLAILIFKFVLWLCLIIFVVAMLRNLQLRHGARETLFLNGKVLSTMSDGFYQGSLGFTSSWIGKKIDSAKSGGINIFSNNGVQTEKYPFITSVSKGLVNKQLDVIKISYDMPENPFWVRLVVDEMVEIAPGEYLGKMHVKIIPGFPFNILFFTLKK